MSCRGNSYKHGYQRNYYEDQYEKRMALYENYKHPAKVSINWCKVLIITVVFCRSDINFDLFMHSLLFKP